MTAKEQGTEAAQGWKFNFVLTNIGFASNGYELFATKNGGQTWGRVASNTMPWNVQDLDFTSNNDGFVLTAKGNVYHTSDGGSTWEQVN
ncbi:WD40/YVTN/BNR-like repeat-containing protein [Alicyclobacillus sp. ALC3]|uniref:WD40/YVTN/BNR-like repeat-containing protein n=1 Tax=Alicyclobacillus sp. ALC3 TaxID=2796143 RepID=UPI003FCC47DC